MKSELLKTLTIENAGAAAVELQKTLKSKQDIVIDLSVVERIDLSGMQILISAQNTGEKQKNTFFYTGTLKKAVFDKFNNNGFSLVPTKVDGELFTIRRSSGEF
jgi:anti-anti-sigma regulatory factor